MKKSLKINHLSDDQLLSLRMKDLKLDLKSSRMQSRIDILYNELTSKQLSFYPHIWISDEWFTPDDVPGFAVPFYLVHPRLAKLEKKQMLEAEGSEKAECLRILRHETGHAISHAYQLYFRKEWKKIFGDFRKPYPLWYVPDVSSRNFVTHLNAWYAQAHPLEDFAETFAVWLKPDSEWENIYNDWPALTKLQYVDTLMQEIKNMEPIIKMKSEYAPLSRLKRTLAKHYDKKKKFYSVKWASSFDHQLKKIFIETDDGKGLSAKSYISRRRSSFRINISEVLNIPQYTVDQIIHQMIRRTEQLNLNIRKEKHTETKLIIILTSQLINIIQSGYHRIPL
jgi:hypothetical protein